MDTDVSHEVEKRLSSLEGRVAALEGGDEQEEPVPDMDESEDEDTP